MKYALVLLLGSVGCSEKPYWKRVGVHHADLPVWRDAGGRTIGRLCPNGNLLHFHRDPAGRIVSAWAKKGPFPVDSARIPTWGQLLWSHSFVYDHRGNLTQEGDCRGRVHSFPRGHSRHVNSRTGTALTSHSHAAVSEPFSVSLRRDRGN